ncbi:MAG: transcriptional repressor [Dehalococcoidia bacterium]|nr:transcriptional repressor [Dehalococcoidia bacterium]
MMRKSKQRDAIVRVLMSTKSHPTAEWIYEEVRKEMPNLSLGTVYRNLRMMKEKGEILELEQTGTFRRFDGNSANHYHFRCEKCSRVFDIDEPLVAGIDERVEKSTGFKVSHHRLEFRGLCRDCVTARNDS